MANAQKRQDIGNVSKICISPIKSARMVELDRAMLTKEGIELVSGNGRAKIRDRQFMIVMREPDGNGIHNFVTQRKEKKQSEYLAGGLPVMSLVRQEIKYDSLSITWKGKNRMEIPLDVNKGREMTVGIWGKAVLAVDQGDLLADWFSDQLKMNVRLVKAAGPFKRHASQKYMANNNTMRFQDGYPAHWLLHETVYELSEKAGMEISWERFRPNIVVSGIAPQAEYLVHTGEINGIRFLNPRPCARCPITTVDQEKGEISGGEPLSTLSRYMRWENIDGKIKVIFGENMLPLGVGEITTGSKLTMLSRREPPLAYGPKV